jgi:hypothetical protein
MDLSTIEREKGSTNQQFIVFTMTEGVSDHVPPVVDGMSVGAV